MPQTASQTVGIIEMDDTASLAALEKATVGLRRAPVTAPTTDIVYADLDQLNDELEDELSQILARLVDRRQA